MKRKVRRFYVYITAFQVIVFAFFQIVSWLIGASGITSLSMIIVPLIYLASAMIWLIKGIVPIFFADWAYREVWGKDEALRVSQLTFRDWLAAIMLPLMQLVGVLFFVGFVVHLIMSAISLWNVITVTSEPLSSSITHFVFLRGAGMLSMPISYGMHAILAITLVLRRIMQLAEGRPAASALPQLALLIAGFAGIFLFSRLPQFLFGFAFGPDPVSLLLSLLTDIFSLAVTLALVRFLWQRDLRIARTFLFSASRE